MSELGVDKEIIKQKGVVSEEVADAMAECVKNKMKTDWAISTTGIAGPSGGTKINPVGTVWIGVSGPNSSYAKRFTFFNNRDRNIKLATLFAINELRKSILI